MKKFSGTLILMFVLVSLYGCTPPPAATPALVEADQSCSGNAITTGDISDDPNGVKESRSSFVNYLAERLAALGYKCGKTTVVDTMDEMIASIQDGQVDIYMDSIYPAMLVSDATGAQPVLRRWRNCDWDYYSIIFTATGSGITTVDDLAGKMIAMDQIYSTSGFALPAAYLLDHGLNLVLKDSYEDPVNANETGIYFSFDDKNTLNLVLEGKVSAGATDDYFFGKWVKEAPGKFIKLAETTSVPRQVVLLRPGLENEVQAAIQAELAKAHLDPAGLAAMEEDVGTCKYDNPPEGIEAAMEQMRAMHAKITAIPGWQEAFQRGQ